MVHATHHNSLIPNAPKPPSFDILRPLRRWIDHIEIEDRAFAQLLCQVIPCACPFERDITLFSYTLHIPALCKLNPLYNEIVNLRFRALTYLADCCGEDITPYLC
ncbi:Mo-dependent nitrogenase C-terminal domain-containing protein [Acaryochloris sp. IP29b_bin.137]|uniref:Mo-dependent nitrogenase C-terminal domain-containing protein n=1 Tax=Acaryochloris sp. IP29b_bin.137 TaxID=2969217 RepID=UPI00261A163A|nr:Mo-dependent nitrogenase C-terminal domain-containing protein [Acaryochloris sp. IP29b_bin.137]